MLFIQGLLIAFFLFASFVKTVGMPKKIFTLQLEFFHNYGLNRIAMFLVGIIEAIGAITMLLGISLANPKLSAIGASLTAFTSIGAIFFHLRFDTWKDAVPSMVTLTLSFMVVFAMVRL
ncbi:DoxX family protein [Vibrio renipiscarius]|uniref:Membrane protein n=1 Tax=Vibrio renipiscarius TaxID=1461322 RepID=A0A0C2NPZ3_9VIBR|nr:DoxX family protein [Vibrio renipiscarius]KII76212.1 membrane protein [Vibrio renipiscarius]KII78266.1 membrane protein [Vibrio renipiscarius]